MPKSYKSQLFIAIGLLLFCFVSNAQKIQYKTHIDSAGTVIIKGGKTTILKVDTAFIDHVIINQTAKAGIYLISAILTKDSSGIYTTKYKFAPAEDLGSFNINISIQFDKPIIENKNQDYIDADYGIAQCSGGYDSKLRLLNIRGIITSRSCTIRIQSKDILFANIYGVEGKIN